MDQKAVIFDYNRTVFDPDAEKLMPNAKEVLTALQAKGIPLFLIAKGDEERKKQIESLGLLPFFKEVIVNQDKSAEDFRSCIQECDEGTKFFAVGDRVREEIRHANECGMTTIWFRNGKFASEEPENDSQKPKFTVSALSEALHIILA